MSNDQTEKKVSREAKEVAIAAPKMPPAGSRTVKKVVLMGHDHTDERLIEIFKKIFVNLPKTNISVAVELPATHDLSDYFEKYKTQTSTMNDAYKASIFSKNCPLTELLSVKDIDGYLNQQKFVEGESGFTVAEQKKRLRSIFLIMKNAPIMLCLFEQIIAGGYTHFCFDATQEMMNAVHAHTSFALSRAREPIMAKNLAAASTPFVFAIIGAAHVAGVKKLLNTDGIETEEVGIKVSEVVDAKSGKIVDYIESGNYESVFESFLFKKAPEAIPAYASVATAATSVTAPTTAFLELKNTLSVSSPQLAAGSAAKVGAGIASIAAAVAANNADAHTPAVAATSGHST
jgi:hypothetical protein